MKKSLVMLMCVLVMGSLSFGAGEITIGGFDGADAVAYETPSGATHTVVTSPGVTEGSNALKIDTLLGGWGRTQVSWTILGTEAQTALASTGTVTMDITANGGEGGVTGWWGGFELFINAGSQSSSVWTTASGGNIVWGTSSYTFQFNQTTMDAIAASNWWCQIGLNLNTGDGATTIYVDNAQIVPEPATLTMLGLGALALLKRRKA